MKTKHQGFTLIELVVVIVILGILAATALPKFVDLGTDARVAAVKSLAGAMKPAAELAHSKCVLVPGCVGTPQGAVKITMPDGTLKYMHSGYPTGRSRLNDYSGISDWVDTSGFTLVTDGGAHSWFKKDGAVDPDKCYVHYGETYNPNEPPDIDFNIEKC